MLPYRDSRLTYIALGIFFLIVLGYAYYEARGILFGPTITVSSDLTELHGRIAVIKGQADRIASLSMNGKTIPVTETGAFEELYILALGYNRVTLDAQDKYGRRRSKTIEIVYNPSPVADSGSVQGTSTPPTNDPAPAAPTPSEDGPDESAEASTTPLAE
ncbi:MAG: hypothetical protein AAB804_03160 [Patescibacteria group bacterium]